MKAYNGFRAFVWYNNIALGIDEDFQTAHAKSLEGLWGEVGKIVRALNKFNLPLVNVEIEEIVDGEVA